jgi:hypothetical protein
MLLILYGLFDLYIGGHNGGLLPLTDLAAAQFTTVTGTVVDPNGIPYALGTIAPVIVIPSGAGSPVFTATGTVYTPPVQASGLDGAGHFIVTLADNTALTPAGTKWNFTVCSAAGTIQPALGKGPVCFSLAAPITISGASQDISSNLNAVALALTVGIGCAAGTCVVNNPIAAQTITGAFPLLLSNQGASLGIGTATVTSGNQFEIDSNTQVLSSWISHVTGLPSPPVGTANGPAPILNLDFSRGTQASPAAVQGNVIGGGGGDPLGELAFGGFDGTSYITGSSSVQSLSLENWTSTTHGSSLQIFTTLIGTNGSQEVFRFGEPNSGSFSTNFSVLNLATGTQNFFCWGTSGGGSGCDTALTRDAAGIVNVGNASAFNDRSGKIKAAGYISAGTTFTASGCTNSALVGGATAGQFTVGQNTACTIVITMGNSATSAHGWTCAAYDETAVPAVAIRQTAHSTTSCSLLMTVATNDVIVFAAAPGW